MNTLKKDVEFYAETLRTIATGISNPDGAIKLELEPTELINWYTFLLEEKEGRELEKISRRVRHHVMIEHNSGLTDSEVACRLGLSRTVVRNIIVNRGYRTLLRRVRSLAVKLGHVDPVIWESGEKICP